MANGKELPPRREIEFQMAANGMLGSEPEVPEPQDELGIDPIVGQVMERLNNGKPVSAEDYFRARLEHEVDEELKTDTEVLEVLVEDQNRGDPNGPEPSKIQNLPFIPSKLQSPINEDDYGSESRP